MENRNLLNCSKVTQAVSIHQLANSIDISALLLSIHLPNPPAFQMGYLQSLLMRSFQLIPPSLQLSLEIFLFRKRRNVMMYISKSCCVGLNYTASKMLYKVLCQRVYFHVPTMGWNRKHFIQYENQKLNWFPLYNTIKFIFIRHLKHK